MYGLNDKILNDLLKVFEKFKDIDKVYIFGSRARGNYKEISDIDICVFGNIDNDLETNIYFEIDDLNIYLKIDLIFFDKTNSKIKKNILKEGVKIYERQI